MISKENLVHVGFVRRAHSFQGNIQINLTKEVTFQKGDFLFLLIDGLPIPFQIQDIKGNDDPVLNLRFLESHEDAQAAVGKEIWVDSERVSESEEESLVGYELFDKQRSSIGLVDDIIELPKQRLLQIEYNNKVCYIPFVEAFIDHINHENKQIWVNLPDGILDL